MPQLPPPDKEPTETSSADLGLGSDFLQRANRRFATVLDLIAKRRWRNGSLTDLARTGLELKACAAFVDQSWMDELKKKKGVDLESELSSPVE